MSQKTIKSSTIYNSDYYEALANEIQQKYISSVFDVSDFEVLSTVRYDPKLTPIPPLTASEITKENFFLFDEHYHRLIFTLQFFHLHMNEKTYLKFDFPYELFLEKLIETIRMSNKQVYEPMKIRVLVSLDGSVTIELHDTLYRDNLLDGFSDPPSDQMWDVYIDQELSLPSPFTSFKTTNRKLYNEARKRSLPGIRPGKEEVLLVNPQGHLMEGSITNVAINYEGIWVTPQLSCGCLCGVMRHFLLRKDYIKEQTIQISDIKAGSEILLFNGVIGAVKGKIMG